MLYRVLSALLFNLFCMFWMKKKFMYIDIYDDIYEYMFSEYNFKLLNDYMIVKECLTFSGIRAGI